MTRDQSNALTDLSFLGLGDRRLLLKRAASAGLAIPAGDSSDARLPLRKR